jgi:hypothetical protein
MAAKLPPAIDERLVESALATLAVDLRHESATEAIFRAHVTLERLKAAHLEPRCEPPMIVIADILDDCRACDTLDAMGIYLLGHLTQHAYADLLDGESIGRGTLNRLRTELKKYGLDFKPAQ